MENIKKNPATGGNRRGAKNAINNQARYSLSIQPVKKVVFVHVQGDGDEVRTTIKPPEKALRVLVVGDREFTRTWNAPPRGQDWTIIVRPPGRGWQLSERFAGYTLWSRSVPEGVQ